MFYFIIIALMISKTNSLILQDPYNILLKDDTDYKIDESILEEEYDLYDQVTPSVRANDSSERKPMTNDSLNNQAAVNKDNCHATTSIGPPIKYWRRKGTPRKFIFINNETDYTLIAYEDFLKEYDANDRGKDELTNITRKTGTNTTDLLHSMKSILTFDPHCKNCTEEELKHIGFKAIYCLLFDYQRGEAPRVVAARLWRIVKIWTLVYLAVALPLWCMKGWCCCCLCCKFFRPRQTIEEAKKYFLRNPPGVLKVNRNEIQYEPSENERDAYEEFEHLLRTI